MMLARLDGVDPEAYGNGVGYWDGELFCRPRGYIS
jgi:hypothetical protein